MFEVVRYRYVVISCFASWFVSELPIGREIESTKNTTNQKRRLIWYLSTQLSRRDKQAISPGRVPPKQADASPRLPFSFFSLSLFCCTLLEG